MKLLKNLQIAEGGLNKCILCFWRPLCLCSTRCCGSYVGPENKVLYRIIYVCQIAEMRSVFLSNKYNFSPSLFFDFPILL